MKATKKPLPMASVVTGGVLVKSGTSPIFRKGKVTTKRKGKR